LLSQAVLRTALQDELLQLVSGTIGVEAIVVLTSCLAILLTTVLPFAPAVLMVSSVSVHAHAYFNTCSDRSVLSTAAQQVQTCCPWVLGGSNSSYDFTSRFFAPWAGIPEDPVTGSAHCVSGPFWAARLGKTRLRARQCSARGGDLWVTVDEAAGRVELAGHAVLVMKGQLLLPKVAV